MRYDQAREVLTQVLAEHPLNRSSLLLLGEVERERRDFPAAAKALRRVIELRANDQLAQSARALLNDLPGN